jgi:diadenosine tetraphosphate (Ap4A) HIT family hydrolase
MSVFIELPQIKERTYLENEFAFAFLTNIPITVGHTLVIPKREVLKYEDLTQEEKNAIEMLRVQVLKKLKEVFDYAGFNFAWNDGKIAGQSVPHFHLHIVGRKDGDTGILEYEPRQFLYRPGSREDSPEEELQAVCNLLK